MKQQIENCVQLIAISALFFLTVSVTFIYNVLVYLFVDIERQYHMTRSNYPRMWLASQLLNMLCSIEMWHTAHIDCIDISEGSSVHQSNHKLQISFYLPVVFTITSI